jgi:toxin ParE1/3/4
MHRRSDEARADLLDIWIHLHDKAGELVADSQIDAITERFLLLAEFPYLGRARDADLAPGRRSYVVGDHLIVYRVDDGDIVIPRVLHGRRDMRHSLD